jgi:3-hydroxyisobutyrate dehydrogenase-like beta-hydroxyacid dehydrogenase
MAREQSITVQDIVDIFAGGHLAASAEALGFTEAVGLDTDVIYDIISKAAGSNVQFVDCVPKMKKPTWSLKGRERQRRSPKIGMFPRKMTIRD